MLRNVAALEIQHNKTPNRNRKEKLDKLTKKTQEVQAELERWAEEEKILGPGQHLLFTLQVVSRPTVVEFKEKDFHQMHPMRFFATERMATFGVEKGIAIRIHRIVGFVLSGSFNCNTMDVFVRAYPLESFSKFRNCGKRTIGCMEMLLKEADLLP
jgi:hypothetical protein